MIAKREQYLAAQQARSRRTEDRAPQRAATQRTPRRRCCSSASPRAIPDGRLRPSTPALQLEPWAVQAALSRRRGGQGLSEKEVSKIKRCTRAADIPALAPGHPRMTEALEGEEGRLPQAACSDPLPQGGERQSARPSPRGNPAAVRGRAGPDGHDPRGRPRTAGDCRRGLPPANDQARPGGRRRSRPLCHGSDREKRAARPESHGSSSTVGWSSSLRAGST